ncbi:MAG: hypothetical protein IJV59_07535 [Eubacterium sp.]|nr:hypothetical protein [Eubacterium sp.]MBQ9642915.1 hypothetical protein [Lachnospiraceae bacterium]
MDELISKKQALDVVLENALHVDEMYDAIRNIPPALNYCPAAAEEALEKQVPKYPVVWGDGFSDGSPVYDMWDCPGCGSTFEIEGEQHEYCPHCGQRINWKGIKEE